MHNNIQPSNMKINVTAYELKRGTISAAMLLNFLLTISVIWFLPPVHAAEKVLVKSNLFEENYYEQNGRNLKSMKPAPETVLELGQKEEADKIRMLESGYDMIGASEFVSGKIDADLARVYGKKIGADIVLVYDKPTAFTTNMVNFDGTEEGNKAIQEANDANLKNMQTIHLASYWAKIPMPLLGVHIIKLVKAAPQQNEANLVEPGLKILAVVKDSPAAKANIVAGDILLKIGEVELDSQEDLFAAVRRYQGQSVDVLLHRAEADVKTTATLNSSK